MNLRLKASKVDAQCAVCGTRYRKRADRVRDPDYCGQRCRSSAINAKIKERAKTCATCGTTFIPRQYQLTVGQGRFCSNICATKKSQPLTVTRLARAKAADTWRRNGNRVPSGPDHPQFMGRKLCGGYVWVWTDTGYIQEHRMVAEQMIGRPLRADEIVHHENRDKSDNRPENLTVMSRAEHIEEHLEELRAARGAQK